MSIVKLPSVGEGEERSAEGHQHAAADQGDVAGRRHRDPGDVGRLRVLADGAQAHARRRSSAAPTTAAGRARGTRRTSAGTARGCRRPRTADVNFGEPRLRAGAVEQAVRVVAGGDEPKGHADAGDVLVDADRHGEQRHQRPGGGTGDDRGDEPGPQRSGLLGGQEPDEGAGVHRPLDAEVEHAGALAEDRAEGAERERRRDRQHRRDARRARRCSRRNSRRCGRSRRRVRGARLLPEPPSLGRTSVPNETRP